MKKKHDIDLIVVGIVCRNLHKRQLYHGRRDFVGPGHDEIMQCLVDLGFFTKGKR